MAACGVVNFLLILCHDRSECRRHKFTDSSQLVRLFDCVTHCIYCICLPRNLLHLVIFEFPLGATRILVTHQQLDHNFGPHSWIFAFVMEEN